MKNEKPLPMTDAEILASFNQALHPCRQVKVLAELNATTKERIIEILVKMGVDRRRLPRKQTPKPKAETETASLSVEEKPAEEVKEEVSTEEPKPAEEKKETPASESDICANVQFVVSDMLECLRTVKAALIEDIVKLQEDITAKRQELVRVEKLIPALEQCEKEVKNV